MLENQVLPVKVIVRKKSDVSGSAIWLSVSLHMYIVNWAFRKPLKPSLSYNVKHYFSKIFLYISSIWKDLDYKRKYPKYHMISFYLLGYLNRTHNLVTHKPIFWWAETGEMSVADLI